MKMKKNVSNNIIIYLFKVVIMATFPLIVFPYASRVLGASEIGKVQYSYSVAGYFQLLSSLGIFYYGVREGGKYKDNIELFSKFCKELLIINFISSCISESVYLIIVSSIQRLYNYRDYLLFFSIYVFIGGWSNEWVANVYEDFIYITVRATLIEVLTLIVALLGLKNRTDGMAYALTLIMPFVLSNLINLIYIKRKIVFSKQDLELGKHVNGIIFLFTILMAGNVYSLLDTTCIGTISDDIAVGLYTAASKYTRLVIQFLSAISAVLLPRLSLYYTINDKFKFEKLFNLATKLLLFIAIPSSLLMFSLSKEIICVFNGNEFIAANTSMKILAIDIVFSAVDGFLGWHILVPTHNEKTLFIATVVGAICDAVLNWFAIPRWGIEGASVATLTSELIVFFICLLKCKKLVSLKSVTYSTIKYLFAALPIPLICMFVVKYCNYNMLFQLIISGICSFVCYVVILTIIGDDLILCIYGKFFIVGIRNVKK